MIRLDWPNPDSMQSSFARNAWEPITVPKWALTIKYLLFCIIGAISFISYIPVLDLTTPTGYITIWAGGLALGGLLGFIGSLESSTIATIIEAIGAFFVVTFLFVLIISYASFGVISVALLMALIMVLPGVRTAALINKLISRLHNR